MTEISAEQRNSVPYFASNATDRRAAFRNTRLPTSNLCDNRGHPSKNFKTPGYLPLCGFSRRQTQPERIQHRAQHSGRRSPSCNLASDSDIAIKANPSLQAKWISPAYSPLLASNMAQPPNSRANATLPSAAPANANSSSAFRTDAALQPGYRQTQPGSSSNPYGHSATMSGPGFQGVRSAPNNPQVRVFSSLSQRSLTLCTIRINRLLLGEIIHSQSFSNVDFRMICPI